VLDQSGTIRLAFVDEDYTKRLDPDRIVMTLRNLRRSQIAVPAQGDSYAK
jgi:hypothetical protein